MKENKYGYNFLLIEELMKRDGSFEHAVYDLQCKLQRDTTIDEECKIIYDMVNDCEQVCIDLSCSIEEAYDEIMH